ncbi:biliverdin-producing heme oxygenase [Roseomonas sp. SSH11]|uniref:Biliverdin-producing heme oxygenase n=1 Tax=Pararoseomonas baculiformis TaxID=2820812 RepID=A0ABS4ADZ8_9PROT|nr:biliverdin-producing heme oxygenase [Pararoseomonas baculiformis]MBP0444459.1 biliverdin-producing heme oxygenase [Pararoseomonas baculiformis]
MEAETLSIRDRLRAGTRIDHDRLEDGLRLADPGLTLERYREVLARFYGFWAGWEPRVAAELSDETFLAPRRRLHLLRDDLHTLGLEARSLPACPPPALHGRAEAMGSLYVMEGSTLGGRVILKALDRLGLPGEGGRSYFAGYGDATGAMWRAFLQRLEAEPDASGVLRGAKATFAALADWMLRPA